MLIALFSALGMLMLLDRSTRLAKLDLLKLKTRCHLFRLRDDLRRAAISGEVPMNWLFDYLDTSISRTISHLDEINLWEGLALLLSHGKDQALLQAQKHIEKVMREKDNQALMPFYYQYLFCL